jgi:hypothetical protein
MSDIDADWIMNFYLKLITSIWKEWHKSAKLLAYLSRVHDSSWIIGCKFHLLYYFNLGYAVISIKQILNFFEQVRCTACSFKHIPYTLASFPIGNKREIDV